MPQGKPIKRMDHVRANFGAMVPKEKSLDWMCFPASNWEEGLAREQGCLAGGKCGRIWLRYWQVLACDLPDVRLVVQVYGSRNIRNTIKALIRGLESQIPTEEQKDLPDIKLKQHKRVKGAPSVQTIGLLNIWATPSAFPAFCLKGEGRRSLLFLSCIALFLSRCTWRLKSSHSSQTQTVVGNTLVTNDWLPQFLPVWSLRADIVCHDNDDTEDELWGWTQSGSCNLDYESAYRYLQIILQKVAYQDFLQHILGRGAIITESLKYWWQYLLMSTFCATFLQHLWIIRTTEIMHECYLRWHGSFNHETWPKACLSLTGSSSDVRGFLPLYKGYSAVNRTLCDAACV